MACTITQRRSTLITRSIAAATLLAIAATGSAQATEFDFQYKTTISSAGTPGIAAGDAFTLDLFVDNGGTSSAGQTWTGLQVDGFTIHAGSYSASYSTPFDPSAYFLFSTDASGNVSLAEFYGTDPSSVNSDTFSASFNGDYVFGDGSFEDSQGHYNSIAASTLTATGNWTNAGAVTSVPEATPLAMSVAGLLLFGVAYRRQQRG
jgi:hypothetical protein